ncbi:MBL fold metallo-hydrolase [Alteromonas ponticola]|uniref:MBL fold metallo-hydrolase n=1 Tax=Alteromonas aquimaris TaxID=2998417 RepID=A0ABT3P2B6_9ALTE|nr:MBL fold metallo-hydrolase [Alteromonas aquimaris]MCW8106911.1 MBL fold metallo-hydrolase [Alteromonas aquimaris]
MLVETFYDQVTGTFTYIVVDEKTKKCAIIDAVQEYDPYSACTSTTGADALVDYIDENELQNEWILETHVHADHITAAHYLQQRVGGRIGIGSGIKDVLKMWIPFFEIENDTPVDGSQYDVMFDDGDHFSVGTLQFTVWHTPGHTPACVSYRVENSMFVGDTLFAPNMGTARCDFPGGSAKTLYNTIQRLYSLPDDTRIFLAHDYPSIDEEPLSCVSIAMAKAENVMIRPETSMNDFVIKREAKDKGLAVPKLLLPAIQANLRNGQFGEASPGGTQFIKIPVNKL